MKKKLLSIFVCILSLSLTTACNNPVDNENNNLSNSNGSTSNVTINEANTYTGLEIYGANIKFKMANPTYFWDCDYDFGAAEISTVFIVSQNGEVVKNYLDIEDMSMITFEETKDIGLSEQSIKRQYKKWHNVDVTVENLEHELYKKHIKGENSETYFETYAFKYDGIFEDDFVIEDIYYSISLLIRKDNYTKEELNKIIEEYHLIIDTLEFVK